MIRSANIAGAPKGIVNISSGAGAMNAPNAMYALIAPCPRAAGKTLLDFTLNHPNKKPTRVVQTTNANTPIELG